MDIAKKKQLKKLDTIAIVVSILVFGLVGLMRRVKIPTDIDFGFIPPVTAVINTLVAICLILALLAIKKKNIKSHNRYINMAMILSALFLLFYVVYHFTTVETTYCKEGSIRYVYYFVLISHIILAGLSLPFILLTYIRGYLGLVDRHRKMAKIVWPIWFYVAITGPITYLMLSSCY